jgi:ammonium transporter Rh
LIVAYNNVKRPVWTKINLNLMDAIQADFGSAAVLISFGAILGKVNLLQLFVMATIEIFVYCLNEAILTGIYRVNDNGGSMIIHTFGAYFGLSVALFYRGKDAIEDKKKLGNGNYLSNLVAMVGTLFLFAYWPSFNAISSYGSA